MIVTFDFALSSGRLDDFINIKISRIKSAWIKVLNGAWMNHKQPTCIRQDHHLDLRKSIPFHCMILQ